MSFFQSVDTDNDGQIQVIPPYILQHVQPNITKDGELRQYLSTNLALDNEADVAAAVQLLHSNLEADDADDTVSEQELTAHLRTMGAQAHRLVDWVAHGLQLPQYADVFRNHSITAVDLPHLVRDGGATLQEMGITLALHRVKVLRGIKRLLLGLGTPPSAPTALTCQPSGGRMRVQWSPPASAGTPPMHKYVLERQCGQGAAWVQLDVALTPDDVAVVDSTDGSLTTYRLRAWNEYDRSEAVLSNACRLRAPWVNKLLCTVGVLVASVLARSAYVLGWFDRRWSAGKEEKSVSIPTYARMHSGLSSTSSQRLLTHSASFGSNGSDRFVLPAERAGNAVDDGGAFQEEEAPKRARCAHCDAKIYVPVIRIKVLGTHYCGVCQRYVCAAHTGASPHGASGDCGVESKCVCVGCLAEMDEGRRGEVLKRNRLSSKRVM